ncbi:hypothetical protein BDN70DRAFT_906328 [Pholiota conissans]|uniref:Uncharacterized protein n=1 Tax=Pholiota conissans TaxID=109636 RepID=A0A9P5Z1C2_9AGAR|nr:hypothetical protein BDN70DRAFT_906328 [Pholiota conissans]
MFAHSLNLYMKTAPSLQSKRRIYVIIGASSVSLTAVVVFTDVVFMEFMWIDHRDFDGGPLGYLMANSSIWWQTFGTAANQVTNFIGDGLLLYRCYIIWGRSIWAIIFPSLIYLSSIAMAMITLVQSAVPGSNFFRGKTVNFGVPWAALSVSLNIIVTAMIIVRLLQARQQLKRSLPPEALQMYTGVSAILIESALPFSILGIAFAITYGKNLDEGPAFLFIWATFCALSPQFIIFRVINGRSWTKDIISEVTTKHASYYDTPMQFRAGEGSTTIGSSGGKTTLLSSSVFIQSKTEVAKDQV